jgi:hypothetical protein
MVDRVLLWLGAGVVTAGMSVAMLTGAGIAAAETGSGTDSGGATSSESSKSAGDKADSDKKTDQSTDSTSNDASPGSATTGGSTGAGTSNDAGSGDSKADDHGAKADDDDAKADDDDDAKADAADDAKADAADGKDEDTPSSGAKPDTDTADPVIEQQATSTTAAEGNDHGSVAAATQQVPDQLNKTATVATEPDVKKIADDPESVVATIEPEATGPEAAFVVTDNTEPDVTPSARSSAVAFSAPDISATEITSAAAAPQPPSLINVIGTFIFDLINFATRLFEGPPVLPAGSTVTVRSSTLQLGCGRRCEVPADWYFPSDPNPTGLIVLQHGLMASGRFYSFTAATLAEQTHSIVVAPTVTSNFFAADGFWLGGATYHQAFANLFTGERTALTDSAAAAIGHDVTLPQRVVIAGHSAGGGMALGVASYMVGNGTIGDLAGLVLLDGVALGGVTSAVFDKLPADLPIYQISSPPYLWNMFGATSDALVQARPGKFNGVQLVGGSHIDAMQGGNPLIQFAAYLVAGFSQPQNIEAVKILATGWINDMFAGTHTGIYADPGDPIEIPTTAGTAAAIALPASEASLSPLDQLLRLLFGVGSQLLFNLGSTATADAAVASKETLAA